MVQYHAVSYRMRERDLSICGDAVKKKHGKTRQGIDQPRLAQPKIVPTSFEAGPPILILLISRMAQRFPGISPRGPLFDLKMEAGHCPDERSAVGVELVRGWVMQFADAASPFAGC